MKIENINTENVIPYGRNARINAETVSAVAASIKEFGWQQPIVIDKDNVIVAGHTRHKAAQSLGLQSVPCVRADNLTEAQIRAYRLLDNKIQEKSQWDFEMLEIELADLDFDFEPYAVDFSFEGQEQEPQSSAVEDDYEIPDEDKIQTKIKLGDLITIGQHRLLCGDSTDAESVGYLMDGAAPSLMVTDPPYGVNYDANWRNEADRANGKPYGDRAIGKVSNDDKAGWPEAYALSPADVAYVWHADRHASEVCQNLIDCDFELRSQIIWAKSNFAISRGHYHWKHEPCWYAVRKGKTASWLGGRKQTTLWEIAKPSKSETGHSTEKPVECMAIPIKNHDGDVHDPFLGSGTTMVAAHQLGRTCYGMELEPRYCQVVIDRMKALDETLEIKINGETYNG
jgi:DNA modification methylase